MKEHIYTIPINDVFDKDCECPICEFLKDEERKLIDYTLGASMMEPDSRILTNENGFCNHHFSMLLNNTNKLSMALILETHLEHIRAHIEEDYNLITSTKKSVFGKKPDISEIVTKYDTINQNCVICNKLENIKLKFIDNIFVLYEKENEFRNKFKNSKGFCFPHFILLLLQAENAFSGNKLTEFYRELYTLEKEHLSRIQEDITWFTKKFDFRYADEDWKNSKDAVSRTAQKISGYINTVKEQL